MLLWSPFVTSHNTKRTLVRTLVPSPFLPLQSLSLPPPSLAPSVRRPPPTYRAEGRSSMFRTASAASAAARRRGVRCVEHARCPRGDQRGVVCGAGRASGGSRYSEVREVVGKWWKSRVGGGDFDSLFCVVADVFVFQPLHIRHIIQRIGPTDSYFSELKPPTKITLRVPGPSPKSSKACVVWGTCRLTLNQSLRVVLNRR